jgi:hypothetical protein
MAIVRGEGSGSGPKVVMVGSLRAERLCGDLRKVIRELYFRASKADSEILSSSFPTVLDVVLVTSLLK